MWANFLHMAGYTIKECDLFPLPIFLLRGVSAINDMYKASQKGVNVDMLEASLTLAGSITGDRFCTKK